MVDSYRFEVASIPAFEPAALLLLPAFFVTEYQAVSLLSNLLISQFPVKLFEFIQV
jgi:hypothetical protein